MNKRDQKITLLNSDTISDNEYKIDSFKTTNVNILLNRVRLDKKKIFKKKLIFFSILVLFISVFIYITSL